MTSTSDIERLVIELADALREQRHNESMDDLLRRAVSAPTETTKRIAQRLGLTHENKNEED